MFITKLKNLKIFNFFIPRFFNPKCIVCILSPMNYISFFLLPVHNNCKDLYPGVETENFEIHKGWMVLFILQYALYVVMETRNIQAVNLYCFNKESADKHDCMLMVTELLFTLNGVVMIFFGILKQNTMLNYLNGWKMLFDGVYGRFKLHTPSVCYFVKECFFLYYLQNAITLSEIFLFTAVMNDNLQYMRIRQFCIILSLYYQMCVSFHLIQNCIFYFIVNNSFVSAVKRCLLNSLSNEDIQKFYNGRYLNFHCKSNNTTETTENDLKLCIRMYLASRRNFQIYNDYFIPEMLIRFTFTNGALVMNFYLILLHVSNWKLLITGSSTALIIYFVMNACEILNSMVSFTFLSFYVCI